MAVLGLKMARDIRVNKLVLQTDNQACIEAFSKVGHQGGECAHIITRCKMMLAATDWEVRIVHCFREGNRVADNLANIGVTQSEALVYFDAPPQAITQLLREDIMGVALPRFIIKFLLFVGLGPLLHQKKKNSRRWFSVFFFPDNSVRFR